jgi:hypothetical protein
VTGAAGLRAKLEALRSRGWWARLRGRGAVSDDLEVAGRFLRKKSAAELARIIRAPEVLVGEKVPWFTQDDLETFHETLIVDLAKDEVRQRPARRALRVSWLALAVSVVSAITAAFTYFAGPTSRGGHEVPAITPQPAPTPAPQNLVPGTKLQQRQ